MAEVSIPRVRACTILRDLKITDPAEISIEDIAWARGALVVEDGLRGAAARLIYTEGVRPAIIRVNKSISPPRRKRFAIAHELGHYELRHSPGAPTECAERQFLLWYKSQNQKEVEANLFAAELLMPKAFFQKRIEMTLPSMDLIGSLAEQFQTTLTATAIRYVDLCGERCALVLSSSGRVTWTRRSSEFPYWISPGRALSQNTFAANFFADQRVPAEMQTVRLDAWIDGNVSSRETIREHSRALSSYESVLTLLWIP